MQEQTQVLTQKERLNMEFLKIAPDVTPKDKQDFTEQFNISEMTIFRYLRGDVTNNDTGTEMLFFFKQRIKARQEKIDSI